MRRTAHSAVLAGAMVLLVACGSGAPDASGSDPAPSTPASSSPPPSTSPSDPDASGPDAPRSASPSANPSPPQEAAGTRIVVADSEFGPMLFDDRRQAIYLFDVEATSTPECYGDCAVAWPPVLTEGAPVAGQGADATLLGTTGRRDGTTQVTYGGHPLYFYAHEGPGEVECHDVFLNGGNWYVVTPDGDRAA